jgi:hypothetical protein
MCGLCGEIAFADAASAIALSADETFGGYHWYPALMQSNDPVSDYARVHFDRDHGEMGEAIAPELMNGDYSRDFVETFFARSSAGSPIDKTLDLDTRVMLVDDPVKRVDNRPYVERLLADPEGKLTPKGHSKLWQVAVLESWMQAHGV